MADAPFELERFLPYLLNQAAERTGKRFEQVYREGHGLTRTQWRIVSHLGVHGEMTAAALSRRSHTEKSKISRAIVTLEADGLLLRLPSTTDRRTEQLQLTTTGRSLFAILSDEATIFDRRLRDALGAKTAEQLENMLKHLAA